MLDWSYYSTCLPAFPNIGYFPEAQSARLLAAVGSNAASSCGLNLGPAFHASNLVANSMVDIRTPTNAVFAHLQQKSHSEGTLQPNSTNSDYHRA